MNYRQAQIFIIITTIIAILLTSGMLLFHVINKSPESDTSIIQNKQNDIEITTNTPQEKKNKESPNLHFDSRIQNLAKHFADLNPEHLIYAEQYGIKPILSTQDILTINRPLVHIKSNENYIIDNLTHSYPYLVPEAAALLDTIANRFNQRINNYNGAHYKLKVTSLLRTQESVNRLQRRNVNSISNSAHLYGTTFDISYVKFHENILNTRKLNDIQLKNILAEVLLQLRDEDKCLVKYERKQGCFHITVKNPV